MVSMRERGASKMVGIDLQATVKSQKEAQMFLFFLTPLGGLLFEITFAKSRGGLLLKTNVTNI